MKTGGFFMQDLQIIREKLQSAKRHLTDKDVKAVDDVTRRACYCDEFRDGDCERYVAIITYLLLKNTYFCSLQGLGDVDIPERNGKGVSRRRRRHPHGSTQAPVSDERAIGQREHLERKTCGCFLSPLHARNIKYGHAQINVCIRVYCNSC